MKLFKTFIIDKQSVLYKHPEIFAKLVWRNGKAKVVKIGENLFTDVDHLDYFTMPKDVKLTPVK